MNGLLEAGAVYATALALPAAVILTLRRPLYRVILDVCGTEARATFWTAYLAVMLTLAPLMGVTFALLTASDRASPADLMTLVIFWSVLGMIVALLIIGLSMRSAQAPKAVQLPPPLPGQA